ncbi:carbohydrate-binding domain-containing protein, partial [Blautia wexlerae]
MRKKLLAGILALALCSTNMPPQTIFAEEFTSGNPDVVSEEETPEIFTNEEQEAVGETDEELSVFSSEEVPEFNDAPDEAMAAAENEQAGEIDLADNDKVMNGVYTISSAGDYKFTCSRETGNRIVVDGKKISAKDSINIYLNKVNINTSAGPALQINVNVEATVTIYLTGTNNLITTNENSAGLQKDNEAQLIITSASNTSIGTLNARNNSNLAYGAGIGGGYIQASGRENTCSGANGSNIHISNSSVNAKSTYGAGIGGGYIRVSGLMNTCSGANSSYIQISNSSVNAKPTHRDSIGGGYISNVGSKNTCSGANSSYIQISGGSVNASLSKSNCPQNTQKDNVYLCIIDNPEFSKVQVDNLPWTPVNHPNDPKLYAWLTGEDHVITVGENETSYIFDSESKTFSCNKRKITAGIFKFDGSHEFTYDGNSKKPSIAPIDTCKGVGTIAVNYYNKRDEYITEPKDVGTYTIKIDVEEGDFYEAISDLTNEDWKFEITSGTLTPTITKYTGTYDGGPHSVIKIDKDTIPPNSEIKYSVDNITWIILNSSNPNEGIPTVRTVKEAENTKIYIRISNTNYNEWISKEYKAIIRPATSTPGFPSDTEISVPWSCKKVEDVKDCLGNNWKWRDSDISKELPVGKEISATAVYNGTDAGNYLNESVEFKITRKECEHKNTVGRYYSSPSCTSSGYSGDTYCNDCKRTIYYGSTIPAYGHDYDNGVITTEPTTETDGIITYTCKRCKHQDTKNLGKLGDGEPYIEGSFQKKGWDTVNDLIKTSKEKDTISIIMNGARTLPASVLSGIKGKDISLNLDMENGFIWKINGTSITAETPADTDLSVTNTAEYIPAALYSLISTNQNDFGFHLGRNGTFDFPAVLSVKADASCA